MTKKAPLWLSPVSYDRGRSKQFATVNTEESMTQQSDKDDCDINIIMKKFGGSGQLPQVQAQALYGDFTNVTDYRTMVETINAANEAFMQIPAETRARFMNDPQRFIDFTRDPNNLDELRKLGLANPAPPPPKEPEPMLVRVVPEPDPPDNQGKKK